MDIYFSYDGQRFVVEGRAYDVGRIVLPDGRLLEASGWLESMPPQPTGLHEINHLFADSTPAEIAQQMNGVVARPA